MAYSIAYEPDSQITYRQIKNGPVLYKTVLLCISILAICLTAFVPSMRNWLWDFMIPGDPEITVDAVSKLVDQLKSGLRASEAIETFCNEIINNG